MVTSYIGIGSNLGDRKKNIEISLQKIKRLPHTSLLKVSKIIETLPVGGPSGQGKFLNAALKIKTGISPLVLLKNLKKIEKELGRVKGVRNGPRTIDLDILLYGTGNINKKGLRIPHEKMYEREFVLRPLREIL